MAQYYKLFTNVFLVKGYSRSIIQDIQRDSYKIVPNFFSFILKITNNRNISEVRSKLNTYGKGYLKYVDFLILNEYMFVCDSKNELKNFPKLDLAFKYPGILSNVVMEDPDLNFLDKSIRLFEGINISFVQLKFFETIDLRKLNIILNAFENGSVRSIEIIVPDHLSFNGKELISIVQKHKRIAFLLLYASNEDKIINKPSFGVQAIIKTKKNIDEIKSGRMKDETYFTSNMKLYTESQKHHTYFNKKIYITQKGEIKNAFESTDVFGNIHKIKTANEFEKIILSKEFQKYWLVNKDSCDVCKYCEFRYVCVDNRLPFQRTNGSWYHKIECSYNPFVAKWQGQKGYKTLTESGVISNELEFKINKKKLRCVNEEIWGKKDESI